MSDDERLAMVMKGYEFFGAGDLDSLFALYHEDIEFHIAPPVGAERVGGIWAGKDRLRELFGLVYELFEFEAFEPVETIMQGDKIVVLGTAIYTLTSTGRRVRTHWEEIFDLRDDKIERSRLYLEMGQPA